MSGELIIGLWDRPASPPRGPEWLRVDGVLHVTVPRLVGGFKRVAAPVPMAAPPVWSVSVPRCDPSPERITFALDLRGLDGPEVDEALGVADVFDTVVDSWESGELIPSVEDIRRLATLTGVGATWFFQGPMPTSRGGSLDIHLPPGR